MPTPAKKEMYAVMRTDNTSVTYEWTKAEYNQICDSLIGDAQFAKFQDGIISLANIRAIVKQEPLPKIEEKPLESGTPEMDVVTAHWLKQQEEMIKTLQEEREWEDRDTEGGRFS